MSYSRGALEAVEAGARMVWRHRVLTALLLVVCVFAVEFTLLKMPQAQAAYTIANSARFISGNLDYLNRTPGSAGSRTKWTYSVWLKHNPGKYGLIFAAGANNDVWNTTSNTEIYWNPDTIALYQDSTVYRLTNATFRDPAAWIHLVVAVDTTQSTAQNRIRMYINGLEITSWATNNTFTQSANTYVNFTNAHVIGGQPTNVTNSYVDDYMADAYLVDGQQLTPTDFGAYDSNGYWRPKSYTGTYGTNGFKLDFANSADFGNDVSGNSNDWTNNNLATTDQMTDTPTNSFNTFSPIDKNSVQTQSKGNLNTGYSGAGGWQGSTRSTFQVSSGKWYWELSCNTPTSYGAGVTQSADPLTSHPGSSVYGYAYHADGQMITNNANTVSNSIWNDAAHVVGFALDLDSGTKTLKVYRDNSLQTNYFTLSGTFFTPFAGGTNNSFCDFDFGQGGTTTLTYDSASGGTFKYTPPSGFKALSTSNLPEPAVAVPKNYFDAITYQGSGVVRTVATSLFIATTTGTTTWMVPVGVTSVDYLVVAGGGAGGGGSSGGGGGAGGMRTGTLAVTPGTILSVTVGAGGTGGAAAGVTGAAGSDSKFDSITALGGGGGGGGGATIDANMSAVGGSGGGKGVSVNGNNYTGGLGTAGQGNNGGATYASNPYAGGGGGGAGAVGGSGASGVNGVGGAGSASSITGSSVTYAGGGGSGANAYSPTPAAGGSGGGGAGGTNGGTAGTANTGGGGGGGGGDGTQLGAAGGSGIVVIKYTPSASTIGFTPSLVWIKDRTSALMHNIFDSVRSVIPYWSSNSSAAEVGGFGQTLTAFLSNGFTIGTNALFNTSGNSYISWLWKESPTSGVDVVTYTGDNTSNRAISHSLGKAPAMIIVKRRDAAGDSYVWHTSLTDQTYFMLLDSVASGQSNTNTPWGSSTSVNFTSSVFTVTNNGTNNANASGATYVAYLFATTTGFADFGQYTANISTDGPFVYTGFKPRFVMIKKVGATYGWVIKDTARDTYNPAQYTLTADSNFMTDDTSSSRYVDLLSNGFKIRGTANEINNNTNGTTYLYAAFAEQPFQQSAQPYNLTIASSTRFNDDAISYLNRTPGGAGNRKTWTASFWVKRAGLGETYKALFPQAGTAGAAQGLAFITGDKLEFDYTNNDIAVRSTRVFRDPAKWYHIVVRMDTTQATASGRFRIWVDNEEITVWDTDNRATAFSQDSDQSINNTIIHTIGTYSGSPATTYVTNGYLSDIYLVDGTALAPTSFGEYDASGYWRPKTYSGSYGTNGFHLPLMGTSTAAGIGIDTSGNNNTWTVNNITTTDFVKDSPTNSFATWSPLTVGTNYGLLAGNLQGSNTGNNAGVLSSTAIPSGSKTYFEFTNNIVGTCTGGLENYIGITKTNVFPDLSSASRGDCGTSANSYCYLSYPNAGNLARNNGVYSAYGNTWCTPGDVVGVAVDLVNNKIWFAKNGTWQNSGDPVAGTNAAFTVAAGDYFAHNGYGGTVTAAQLKGTVNFGQGGQSGLTYDSASGGTFKYTPPSGFKALSTNNLPTPTVTIPKNYFDARLYTGTGATQSIGSSATPSCTGGTYASGMCRIFLTSGTSWTVPGDWNSSSSTIETIGGGGGGAGSTHDGTGGNGGAGGGGGGYSKITNLSLTAGASVAYAVGAAGAAGTAGANNGGAGGDTYFCNSTSNCASISGTAVGSGAKGGSGGTHNSSGGAGGASGSGVGTVKNSGGTGGTASAHRGGGGAGAGGPNGTGGNGGTVSGGGLGAPGGGGNGGGTAGSANSTDTGGAGGNNSAGAGGGAGGTGETDTAGAAGTSGGGGGGGAFNNSNNNGSLGGVGGAGTEWDSTHGSGGGAGAPAYNQKTGDNGGRAGSAGGLYGGGGSGGSGSATAGVDAAGGAGAAGIVVITYTPNPVGFQPDIVWIKDRTSANAHGIFASSTTLYPAWASNATNAEGGAGGTALSAFLSNGFSLGASSTVNTLADNFVAWMWKGGGTAVSNTAGSITSSVSANTTSGFSVVTYTGTGANATVGHGLSTAPSMIIVVPRDQADERPVFHTSANASPASGAMILNTTAAFLSAASYWNSTVPAATVFSIGTTPPVNASTKAFVAYVFAAVEGFSKFGSYTGNGSADGPFIYTGFKPRFIMWKRVNSTGSWGIYDTARSTYNPANAGLLWENAGAEFSYDNFDILSNGFKVRVAGAGTNANGDIHIYAAFAEQPFKYSAASASSVASTFVQAVAFLMGMTF